MKVLSTDGLTKLIQLIKSAFISVDDTVTTTTVELADVATTGDYNDLLNKPTIPTVNDATLTIQQNGTDVQIFSANASSNVTANITVPTSISDLTDDTSTTPIDKADTLTGLTASVTELNYVDGVTSSIQTQIDGKADITLSNVASIDANSAVQTALDSKVSKSGDTMTGDLNISKTNPQFHLINTDMELGVTPSENYVSSLRFIDKNETNLGNCYLRQQSSGITDINLNCINPSGGSAATLRVGFNAKGDAYSIFPNTYRCDGQWIISNLTLANSVAVSSSNVTYSLASYLPDDGYNYEVLLVGSCSTDAVSGHFSRIIVLSDLVGDYVNMMQVRTRTASTVDAAGNCIIPVGVGRTITFVGSTSNNFAGTYTLVARAYRRIGANS